MKKIIYFLCIMFFTSSIKAISPEVIYQDGIYSNRIGDKLYSGQMAFIFMDSHIVYCLEPFQLVGRTYYENNSFLNRYDTNTLEYFELVSYYGYNQNNRNSIYYYMAAQELIWERILGGDYVYWTTEENGNGELINIDNYKNEIINDVNRVYLMPSFNGFNYSFAFFTKSKIYDTNNIFNTYTDFKYEGNSEVIMNDRGFIVNILAEEEKKVTYSKTIKTDNNTIVYTGTGNQTLASFGLNKVITGEFTLIGREYYTNLSVVFYDEENNMISDVNFEMTSDKKLTGEWKNRKGIYYYSDEVNEGNYKIEVVNEYEIINNNCFEVNKKDLQQDTTIEIYLRKIEDYEDNDNTIKDDENNDNTIKDAENNIIDSNGNENVEIEDRNEESDKNTDIDNNIDEETNDDASNNDSKEEITIPNINDNIENEDKDLNNDITEDNNNTIKDDENNIMNSNNNENIEIKDEDLNNDIIDEKDKLLEKENYNFEVKNNNSNIITSKSELIELPNTINSNLKKYIFLFVILILGTILYEKESRN